MKYKKILITGLLLIFTVSLVQSFFQEESDLQYIITNVFYLSASTIAFIAGIYAVKEYGLNSTRGKAILFITLGLLSWMVGEYLWSAFELIFDIDPFPSSADVSYILAYPLLFIGLLYEIRLGKISWSFKKYLMLGLATIAFSIITIYFGIYLAYDVEATLVENMVSIFYGVGDLILIVISLLLLILSAEYKGGKMFSAWLYVFVAMILMWGADIGFAMYTEEYESSLMMAILLDHLWTASYLFFTYALFNMGFVVHQINANILQKLKTNKT
ncbi:hypothetical protein ACFL3C_05670 [Patescibacteria group bacterium]